MTEGKRHNLYIEDELWEKAKTKANGIGLSLSVIIRWFLIRWLNGELEAVPQKELD